MHCGSHFAIASDKISDEVLKFPTIQRHLREIWQDCLDERKQKTHLLVENGEPTDGPGEILKGAECWTTEQRVALADSYRLLKKYDPKYFMAPKGSDYHSNMRTVSTEEMLIEKFGDKSLSYNPYEVTAQISEEGSKSKETYNFAWIDVNGLLLCITHHIGGSRWFNYRPTPLGREMAALTFEADKWLPEQYHGRKFIVVRSHQHNYVHVGFSSSAGFVTPAWKLPDWFILRGGMGGSLPSLGTVEVIVEPDGEFEIHPHIASAKKYPKSQVLVVPE